MPTFSDHGAIKRRLFALHTIATVTCPLEASEGSLQNRGTHPAHALMQPPPLQAPFEQRLSLQGIGFHILAENSSSGSKLRIAPNGLSIDNSVQERLIGGQVTGAEIADLNVDGWPEVYVFVRGFGPGAPGSLVAMSVNNGKSISDVSVPALTPSLAKGYRGHDQFAVLEGVLGRRFPVFPSQAPDAQPTKIRQIQYRLTTGEAIWKLVVARVFEY